MDTSNKLSKPKLVVGVLACVVVIIALLVLPVLSMTGVPESWKTAMAAYLLR